MKTQANHNAIAGLQNSGMEIRRPVRRFSFVISPLTMIDAVKIHKSRTKTEIPIHFTEKLLVRYMINYQECNIIISCIYDIILKYFHRHFRQELTEYILKKLLGLRGEYL